MARSARARALLVTTSLTSTLALGACGGSSPPPAAPPRAAAPAEAPKAEPPPDVSEVPEPAMLVATARFKDPRAAMRIVAGWLGASAASAPSSLDAGAIVDELMEAPVADALDLSQPVDAAAVVGAMIGRPSVLAAVAFSARLDETRDKLVAKGLRVAPRRGGGFTVDGFGPKPSEDEDDLPASGRPRRRPRAKDPMTCALVPAAPAAPAARLVCGEPAAVDALAPWLARTAPRRSFPADVHAELRPLAVRDQILALRPALPSLVRSFGSSSSPSQADILEATASELADLATDLERVTLDATLEGEGATLETRVDYAKTVSATAQLSVAHPEHTEAPPEAFWRLPADTEVAGWGHGSDPKVLERARTLLAAWVGDELGSAGAPDAERRAFQELLAKRLFPLFVGPLVYAKGTDDARVTKAVAAYGATKDGDAPTKRQAARDELVAQGIGWHLARVEEPISKVGPLFRELTQLWARPAVAKWRAAKLKESGAGNATVQLEISAAPKGVVLPKDTVHLELVVPRPAGHEWDEKTKKEKKFTRPPVVFHFYAVPDSGSTWIALGMDGKLVGERAASVLASAPDKDHLAQVAAFQGLRDVKASSAMIFTVRGAAVTELTDRETSSVDKLARSPTRGLTPIPLLVHAEGRNDRGAAGSSIAKLRVPRAAIEDILLLLH